MSQSIADSRYVAMVATYKTVTKRLRQSVTILYLHMGLHLLGTGGH